MLTSYIFYIFAFILYLTLTHHAHFSRDDVATRPMSTSTQFRTRRSLTYPQPHALRSQTYALRATLPIATLTVLPTLLVYRAVSHQNFPSSSGFPVPSARIRVYVVRRLLHPFYTPLHIFLPSLGLLRSGHLSISVLESDVTRPYPSKDLLSPSRLLVHLEICSLAMVVVRHMTYSYIHYFVLESLSNNANLSCVAKYMYS